jgi:hypothetical protein
MMIFCSVSDIFHKCYHSGVCKSTSNATIQQMNMTAFHVSVLVILIGHTHYRMLTGNVPTANYSF